MIPENEPALFRTRVMELANSAIVAHALGDYVDAVRAGRQALSIAEDTLPDDDVVYWVRSALGSYLFDAGDYLGALAMAGSARAYCASVRAPLALLTMARSSLKLGDVARARTYARQACELRGETVLASLTSAERDALDVAAPGQEYST